MDEFFQRLREIQKKERTISGLADVGDNFYNEVFIYLNKLLKEIGDNPLSFYSYLHRDARRIAAEIGERREHKIINSALLNIQKSQELFSENSSKNGIDSPALPPQNMTPEEENLYYSISKSFSKYREGMVNPLTEFKAKKEEVKSSKIEEKTEKPEKIISKPKGAEKGKKRAPLGIEHDIESYQSYEIPEIEEPENIPEIIGDEIPDGIIEEISRTSSTKKNQIKTLIVLEELPSIIGVDREIYGPMIPQDIVAMPEANAQIIIKNNKGRFIKKREKVAYQ